MQAKQQTGEGGGGIYVAFVDFKKAFDTVGRVTSCETLEKLKTASKITNMTKARYSSVESCVRWGAKFSEFFPWGKSRRTLHPT